MHQVAKPRSLARNLHVWLGGLAVMVALPAAPALADGGYRHFLVGDRTAPRPGPVSGGLLLMGGGERDPEVMRWFFQHAGGGHIVILRASYGGEIGKEFFKGIGGIRSAETFVFSDRKAAYDPKVIAALRKADGIFIAGGDQANYVRFWRGTPVAEALDAHVAAGKPLGGTSAGLAMLGELLYGASDGGSLTGAAGLADPFGPANTIEGEFLHLAALHGVITDTHFKERDRLGRLFAFVAKAQAQRPVAAPALLGLGVDEDTSLAVEADGTARVHAPLRDGRLTGGAWLVKGEGLRIAATPGPLSAQRVRVIGIGQGSTLHLPQGTVDNPAFLRDYSVEQGRLAVLPSTAEGKPESGSAGGTRQGD